MAATIRIASIVATTANPNNWAHATSNVTNGSGPVIRIADITATTVSSSAQIRIADIIASSGNSVGSGAQIRIADVTAVSVQGQSTLVGTTWVPLSPTGALISNATATSTLTGTTGVIGGALISKATATSTLTGIVSFSGSVTVPVGVTTTDSGVKDPVPGDASGTVSTTATVNVSISGAASVGPPGAGSLTVTPDPVNDPPRVLLSLLGALGPTVTIQRIDDSGRKSPVRLANPGTLNGGGWLGYDYEPPYGVTVRYQATATRVITSDPVELTSTRAWLIHPGIPDLSQPLKIAKIGDSTQDLNQSVQYAAGRPRPITETDGTRHDETFELTVKTDSQQELDGLRSLLADGSTLLLQIVSPTTDRTEYYWVAVGAVTRARRTLDFGDARRIWTLPLTVTDPPSGLLLAQRTWADVVAEFPTWQDVLNTYDTWADVITDNRRDG